VEEIVGVMRQAGGRLSAIRIRGLIVVLWRAGLRIDEALRLAEVDLDERRGALLVRHGKGGKRREVGMDAWGWEHLWPWLTARVELPVGPLFCVIEGPTRGRAWSPTAARAQLRQLAADAGVRALRTASAAPRPRGRARARGRPAQCDSAPARHRQRDNAETIATVHAGRAPMMPATTGLALNGRAR
jgi:integrase